MQAVTSSEIIATLYLSLNCFRFSYSKIFFKLKKCRVDSLLRAESRLDLSLHDILRIYFSVITSRIPLLDFW